MSLTPRGAIGIRSRAGAPVRLTLPGGGQWRARSAALAAPTPLPTEAGRPTGSLSKLADDGGPAPQRREAPICFQGSAGALVRFIIHGCPCATRTRDPDLRTIVLYFAELRGKASA